MISASDKLDKVLDALAAKRVKDREWEACCPAHDDSTPSLTVSLKGDKILLCCHAGCTNEAVVRAARLEMTDLFLTPFTNGSTKPQIVATYDYCDERGTLRYQAVRYTPKDFRLRAPGGKGGWKWKVADIRKVPYRLPELLAASPEVVVFIVEGEKDVDAVRALGLTATCNVGGALKWRDEYTPFFAGRNCVILPDNDEKGRAHKEQVAAALYGTARSVRVLELPGLPDKGDVSDWLKAGGTKEELLHLLEETGRAWEPQPVGTGNKPRGYLLNGERGCQVPGGMGRSFGGGGEGDDEKTGAAGDPNLTDLGNARRVVERHGNDLRYCHPMRTWFVWDGRRWAEDQTGEAMRRVKEAAVALGQWAAEQLAALGDGHRARKAKLSRLLSHALKWEDSRRLSSCLELVKSEPGIPILPAEMDGDPWLLNVANGTVDLRTGELRPHRREDLITKLCPVAYDPSATCPQWDRFLDRIMEGKPALPGYLQRVAGYSLTGDVREQCLWLLFGAGANGKSTYLGTLRGVMGDYAIQAVSELLMSKNTEAHPTERADLMGTRFVATIETDEGKRIAEALTKQLTGGDMIRARKMRQDFIEFQPTWKIHLAANHKPVIRGDDHAIWRRIKLVPFSVTIPDAEKDKELPAKLREEWPGILAWAVRGCLDWQRDGLAEPDEVRKATGEYQGEQDIVTAFVKECCVIIPEARTKASALYAAYCSWSGDKFTTPKAFGMKVESRGYERVRGHGGTTFYRGIGLPEEQGEASG